VGRKRGRTEHNVYEGGHRLCQKTVLRGVL
jgi:hypothetical protein